MENLIKKLKNTKTGKTLEEEGRIKKSKVTPQEFVLEYDATSLDETDLLKQIQELYPNYTKDQIYLLGKRNYEGPKMILGISSAKGGVGKSTIALNLALAFKTMNLRVGLLDADIYGPSLGLLLGQKKPEIYVTEKNKIIPFDYEGLKFMTFSAFIKNEDPVIWRGPILNGVMRQFLYDVDWSHLDLLVIDLPPGTGDVYLSLVQLVSVTGVVLVSTPQQLSLLDTMRGFHLFEKFKVPVLGLISNMAYFLCDCGQKHYLFGQDIKLPQNIKLLGELPLESSMYQANDLGTPYFKIYSQSLWTKTLQEIAKNLKTSLESQLRGELQQKDHL